MQIEKRDTKHKAFLGMGLNLHAMPKGWQKRLSPTLRAMPHLHGMQISLMRP
jgi:hypothetical protein